uniref:hypothetical protein n=1 Tax=uncultured Tenacibaculum sp. TaxID=174713 RepID=UPI00262F5C7F|nr:hypothetical protein [uncultured Tenacibaculum sp.]
MKNLILAAAILAGASTYATVNNTNTPITQVHKIVENGFQEISLDKIPTTITNSLKNSFPSATLSKAFVNEKEQYKLEISVENETKTLYADKDGNWLEAKDVK